MENALDQQSEWLQLHIQLLTNTDDVISSTVKRFNTTITEEIAPWDTIYVLPHVLGDVLSSDTCEDGLLEWTADSYVATKVGQLVPALLNLHASLPAYVPNMPEAANVPWESLAVANNELFKSMAIKTPHCAYMVLLVATEQLDSSTAWAVHIRQPTPEDLQASASSLSFLDSLVGVGAPATPATSAYFRYKDGRDQGFVCSIEPSVTGRRARAIDSLVGYRMLRPILTDIRGHALGS